MDLEYMRSRFHQTHYEFFYRALPTTLKSAILAEVVSAGENGTGNQYLVGFWRATAKFVCGLQINDTLPRDVAMTRDDFSMTVVRPSEGTTLLLMTGPAPRGPVEAGCAVAIFEDARPFETMRYFTSEAPMEPTFPWMVGEWFDNGSRANLGGISDVSAQGMCNFVLNVMGLPLQNLRPATTQAVSPAPTNLRLGFSAKWNSSASQLANETVENLYRLRSAGGKALVMNAKKTRGLSKKTSSYVQFMWNDDGSLIVEVQGDYSYWGLSVPSSKWGIMQASGLSVPTEGSGNFALLVPSDASMSEHATVLTRVFAAFLEVLQPDGKVIESYF